MEDDHEPGSVPNPEVKKSRFLKKERKVELSYKDQVEEPAAPEVPRRRRKEVKNMYILPIWVFPLISSLKPLASEQILTFDFVQAKPLPELKEPVAEEKTSAEVKRRSKECNSPSFLSPP